MKTIDKTFENLYEFSDFAENVIKEGKWYVIKECDNYTSFFGGKRLETTLNEAKYGNNEYTSYFLENIEDIKENGNFDNGLFMDIEGFAYDMGAVVNGEPECCSNCGSPTNAKTIKIIVDISFNCNTSAEYIKNRGIAITNLVNTLLAKKYIVEIVFMCYNNQKERTTNICVNVNTDMLPISSIAFMTSPQFFRQLSWIVSDEIAGANSELGRGQSNIPYNIKYNDKHFFIGGSYNDVNYEPDTYETVEKANEYITEKFNAYCRRTNFEEI